MSVAVLFLESRDTSISYLAEGLTEDIATTLGQVTRVQVKPPGSVRRAQREAADFRSLGRALNVHYVVDGSVRRVGDRYRVAIRLVTAQNEVTAWGSTYDRTAEQLLELPAEIAGMVAGVVTGTTNALAPARPTRDAAAYDRYQRGNYFLARRTGRWAAQALAEYQAAVRIDPAMAPAHARLALAYALVALYGWPVPGLPRDSLAARTTAAAARAMQLDSLLSESWIARAHSLILTDPLHYRGVLASYQRALDIDPRNPEAWHQMAGALADLGRDSAAAEAYHRALALDPERPVTLHSLALLAHNRLQYEEALRWEDSALAADPDFQISLWVRLATRAIVGRFAESRIDLARLERLGTPAPMLAAGRAWLRRAEGDSAGARADVNLVRSAFLPVQRPSTTDIVIYASAMMAVDDRGAAVDFLERARPLSLGTRSALRLSALQPLLAEPRVRAMVAEAER